MLFLKNLVLSCFCLFIYISTIKASCFCNEHDCDTCRQEYVRGYGSGSSGKWGKPQVPKRNWTCFEVEDTGSVSQTCDMCETNDIRYVHKMTHPFYDSPLEVGCVCAGYMDGTLGGAKNREKSLRNRTARRNNWCTLKGWGTSKNGRPYINKDGNIVSINKSKYGNYCASIKRKNYPWESLNSWVSTLKEAQLQAFDVLYPSKISLN